MKSSGRLANRLKTGFFHKALRGVLKRQSGSFKCLLIWAIVTLLITVILFTTFDLRPSYFRAKADVEADIKAALRAAVTSKVRAHTPPSATGVDVKAGDVKDGDVKDGDVKAGDVKDGDVKDGDVKDEYEDEEDRNVKGWDLRLEALREARNETKVYECTENNSERDVAGFAELKPQIQDFLLYRHCRYFRRLLDVPEKCGPTRRHSAGIFLLLVIKTTPSSYDRREVVRQTWGAERRINNANIRRVFLTGREAEGELRGRSDELLRMENRRYGDILQWDFLDTFFNLTIKQLLFLDWLHERCPLVRFLFNADDDIFANTDKFVPYLQGLDTPGAPPHLYMGQVLYATEPIRWAVSKYYIPPQVYAGKTFPPYCTGGGFLLSRSTAQVILGMSPTVPLMPIDDVYIGLCLDKASLRPSMHFGFLVVGERAMAKLTYPLDPCLFRDIFLAHGFQTYEIMVIWERIHAPELMCGIPDPL
ncbi:acetylgalactosaminyl-O-glycosyl-glycoprotein beta-1,3-N-acetylglucosaminyltransferase-like [Conger conger]|uniref:acetylgalactosaminyl-O-glycosyl-glycoprotein beta-1,3-N-acetylglucosaminyltransferase-like n=1 Tax=Conger conger TaxID=82655 RepID=UPI002A5B0777|nr:acetylgalactosaminyl-O-glycosyl-glycoprotein beta-1,3-N-acetylglucosaminyltransferase-like [Conger conger]